MSLKRFESFLRRMSRILYEDDLTPLIFDYLLKNQMYGLAPNIIGRSTSVWRYSSGCSSWTTRPTRSSIGLSSSWSSTGCWSQRKSRKRFSRSNTCRNLPPMPASRWRRSRTRRTWRRWASTASMSTWCWFWGLVYSLSRTWSILGYVNFHSLMPYLDHEAEDSQSDVPLQQW